MSTKIDRARHGPGWAEVIFGAVLAAVLGAAIGAAVLVLKPVTVVRELPKADVRDPKAVYLVEGSRDGSQTQVLAKRKTFLEGQSISVTEGDLNAAASALANGPKTEPAKEGAADGDVLAAGTPNFRIREGVLQMAVPLTINVLGSSQKVMAQSRGGFVKQGDVFEYHPEELYLGSCPLQRLPWLPHLLREKVFSSQLLPPDLRASWVKLSDVSIEGNALRLTMP
jgi:hypothetical protein